MVALDPLRETSGEMVHLDPFSSMINLKEDFHSLSMLINVIYGITN
jgi:hypothetical protein